MTELDTKALDEIIKRTLEAVESGKSQIYDVYEAARNEMDNVQRDVEKAKKEIIAVIFKVDELDHRERRGRIRLMEVSRNFSIYTEQDIRQAYEEANNLQVELAISREQEQSLRQRRDELEIRLKKLQQTVGKAEELVSKVGVVLGFLSNEMGGVLASLDTLQQRQCFGAKIIQAQEEERRRVAREIHDGPAQSMASVVFRAEVCERLVDIDIVRCKGELSSLREQVRSCLKEIRKIIFALRPMTLDDLGLVPTLRRILESFQERTTVSTELTILGQEKRVDSYVEVAIFRVIQEAMNNVEKHAQANHVRVILEFSNHTVKAVVTDDGIGFENVEHIGSESFGLMGMKERLSILDGELAIESKNGQGTKIKIRVPLA
ncbi:two-component system sensor histidine kinase DegS [Sporomusaceae bacterium BoRhaA]|uniref:sensor histidine kinase n=1 Tax=Pelorhabdus rhamnosifermentans TaxID=2772457 RepID=UPI001C060567|nr:sensor histidine kinase [Pelorhabdus rhamnosifermentans]MBU2702085.1 two-component system sensor histidine kinase DegS [Pelorhabdus rhamnosifermentans]